MPADLIVPPLLLIDGVRRAAVDGRRYPVLNPATGEVIAEAPDAGPADLDAALAAADRAKAAWAADPDARVAALRALHAELTEHADAMRALLIAEAGVPTSLTRTWQYDDALARFGGLTATGGPGHESVTAVLTPWTTPFATALDHVGAALAAGSTVVLKPAADTPWTAAELGRLAAEHLPPGVLNVITTRDVDVAIAATTDPRVGAIGFTGSAVVAERVRVAAERAGTRLRAETGGAGAPVVIGELDTEELGERVAAAAREVCAHAGQRCGVATTVAVPAARYQEAVEAAVAAMRALAPGDPEDPATVCGPVISPVHRARVLRYLALATAEGGGFATGGGAAAMPGRLAGGFWVEPTVVTGLTRGSRLVREELLAPILVVVPYDP